MNMKHIMITVLAMVVSQAAIATTFNVVNMQYPRDGVFSVECAFIYPPGIGSGDWRKCDFLTNKLQVDTGFNKVREMYIKYAYVSPRMEEDKYYLVDLRPLDIPVARVIKIEIGDKGLVKVYRTSGMVEVQGKEVRKKQ